jgi:hypothetical protein
MAASKTRKTAKIFTNNDYRLQARHGHRRRRKFDLTE